MSRSTYQILDEPRPAGLAKHVVEPFWPLFATMLAGSWLGFPWFAFNAIAVGSATKGREILTCIAGIAGSVAIVFAVAWLYQDGTLTKQAVRYALIAAVLWKLACAYALMVMQGRSLELFEYFGGEKKNGMLVVLAGFFASGPVAKVLGDGVIGLALR